MPETPVARRRVTTPPPTPTAEPNPAPTCRQLEQRLETVETRLAALEAALDRQTKPESLQSTILTELAAARKEAPSAAAAL